MPIKSRKYHPSPRRNRPALSTAGLAAGLALALPAAGSAGEARVQETETLGEIEVTGTIDGYPASPKYTQPLQHTPQTIQIIDNALFTQQGATSLTEALRNSPGVGTFYAGENGSTSTGDAIYMRGFDTAGSIFVDGVRDVGSISRDLFNVESVEVEKGPAGTDNGRSAPTGAINMVTRQALLQDAVSGIVSAGVDGQKRATVDWKRILGGVPGSALRMNAMWQSSDVAGRDHVNNSRWGLAPSLGFGLNGATRLYLNLLYVEQDNVPDGFVPTIGLPGWTPQPGLEQLLGHPVDPHNFYGTHADHDDVSAKMATLRAEHDFRGTLKLTNTLRWGETRQDYLLSSFMGTSVLDAGGHPTGNIRWTDINDLSTYTIARSNDNFKDQNNRILTDQLNLRQDFATGSIQHHISGGVELTREQQHANNIAATGSRPGANLYDPDWNDAGTLAWARNGSGSDGRTDTAALYVFDTVNPGQRWLVTAGARADHYRTDFSSTAVCNNITGRGAVPCGATTAGSIVSTADLATSDTLFNWKLGVVFNPLEALSLYVDYALSQEPPGGGNFQLSTSPANANDPDLDPQKARTLEIGGKWSVLENRLSLNLALYRTNVSNEINSQILDDTGNPTQTGRKQVKGVEFSASGSITANWQVSAGYSHQGTRVVEGPPVTSDGTPNLTYTPGDSFTTWSSYRLPLGLTVGGGLRFVGGLHRGTDGAVGTPATTGGYGVLDAVASYAASERVSWRLNAYNITDRQYVAAINKSGYRYTPGVPRTYLLSLDVRF